MPDNKQGKDQYTRIITAFAGLKVMVLGDLMLDHYIWGKVERISPEAPVPVLDVSQEEYRLGGAANVALNLKALGAEVCLIGVHGKDAAARILRSKLSKAGISTDALLALKDRRTTLKTRIGSRTQQIVRVDYEHSSLLSAEIEAAIVAILEAQLPGCDALIIEDYDKGLLTPGLISEAIRLCRKAAIPVAVDPKLRHFFHYNGVDIFKPNYSELQRSLGMSFEADEQFFKAASETRTRMNARFLVLTRGARGMYVFSDGPVKHLPTVAREVFDVSGAGDTVISVLTLAWICGAEIDLAANLANHAAGVVCGKLGTASATAKEILDSIHEQR